MADGGLTPWLARRARAPPAIAAAAATAAATASANPSAPPPRGPAATRLHAELSAILLGAGDAAGDADPDAVALLARLVAAHVDALLARTLDETAHLMSEAASSGAPAPALDGAAVAGALRSAGLERHASRVSHVLSKHALLTRSLLVCDLSGGPRAEAEAYAAWGERPPTVMTGPTRSAAAAKSKLLADALAPDLIVTMKPAPAAGGGGRAR